MNEIKRGTQIAYIPPHAKGDIGHPGVEFGFVVTIWGSTAFCRYWSKHHPDELRTKANSEATPISRLVLHISHSQSEVDELLDGMMI